MIIKQFFIYYINNDTNANNILQASIALYITSLVWIGPDFCAVTRHPYKTQLFCLIQAQGLLKALAIYSG